MSFGEFTLAVEPVLAIMSFKTKWLIENTGSLTDRELVLAQFRTNLTKKHN